VRAKWHYQFVRKLCQSILSVGLIPIHSIINGRGITFENVLIRNFNSEDVTIHTAETIDCSHIKNISISEKNYPRSIYGDVWDALELIGASGFVAPHRSVVKESISFFELSA